ncbi:MAG: (E)-4-hydroxy-3-methylbut-2-enyl-diphosphate synthase [Thermovirgaceae bacterium]
MAGRTVMVGSLGVGNGFPVRVESMLKTPLQDLPGCLEEARSLAEEGCELVRVAFPEVGLSRELSRLIEGSPIEVMADIHFDHRLAIRAIDSGGRSVRINPGNMGGHRGMSELSRAVRDNGVVVRIGANSGSLSRSQMEKAGGDAGRALFNAVSEQVGILLDWGVEEMILSAKSSSIKTTLRANSLIASTFEHPVHIGLTESGPGQRGIIKSSVAVGSLLGSGIGDTIRISLTGTSREEVIVGKRILQSSGIRRFEAELVSCPGCGRRRVDVDFLVGLIEPYLVKLGKDLKVAVMGCEVNGPGEAADSDIGIAGTPSGIMLFSGGKAIESCDPGELPSRFLAVCRERGFISP